MAAWIFCRVPLEAVPDTFAMLLDKEASGAFKAVVEPQSVDDPAEPCVASRLWKPPTVR